MEHKLLLHGPSASFGIAAKTHLTIPPLGSCYDFESRIGCVTRSAEGIQPSRTFAEKDEPVGSGFDMELAAAEEGTDIDASFVEDLRTLGKKVCLRVELVLVFVLVLVRIAIV